MQILEIIANLEGKFNDVILSKKEFRGETTFVVKLDGLRTVMEHCKNALGFDYLIDASSVDNFGDEPRFEVVYELYSLDHHNHLRITAAVSEDHLSVPTVSDLWATANWHEREIFDMMGIRFDGHPDLRRILMWDGYPYFPLRKDFPLEGKDSDVHEVAFSAAAPLAGGPFVTTPTTAPTHQREPRALRPD